MSTLTVSLLLFVVLAHLGAITKAKLAFPDCTSSTCSAANQLSFLIIGDWGQQNGIQSMAANAAGTIAKASNVQFVISPGDQFYESGVSSTNDPQFNATFENVFTAPSLNVPWYPTCGNHDANNKVGAWKGVQYQIGYTNVGTRWNYPSNFYTISYTITGGKKPVRVNFVSIDTVQLCGNTRSDVNGGLPVAPNTTDYVNGVSQSNLTWINKELSSFSNSDYLFVFGHFPVFSSAQAGNTPCLLTGLVPLLAQYNVSAYISGHSHNLQHFLTNAANANGSQTINQKMNYIVSGLSSQGVMPEQNSKYAVPKGSQQFFFPSSTATGNASTVGFNLVTITSTAATVAFLNGNGAVVYQTTIQPRA